LQTSDNNSSRQIVYNKIKGEEIKPRHRDRRRGVAGWSGHYYLWACRRARSAASDRSRVYEYAASIKEQYEMNKNEETESLMIGNILELVEATRREVVVGEVATATTEFLAAASFAIHVAMQLVLKVLICAR
jgi:hypothetical protein